MSANNWKGIDYEKVPSKANIIYKNAFMKHDKTRRSEYLDKLSKGDAKINSGVAFPYDIVHSYCGYGNLFSKDETLEGMWKSLPDYLKGNGSDTICMVDGSYSMTTTIGRTSLTCMEVAQSLGIYFAERMNGAFNNKFITFSRDPQLVSFNKNWTLRDKIIECRKYTECANTDIYKAFKLILNIAKNNNLKQEEIPQNILILSDMEFDSSSVYIKGMNCSYNEDQFNCSCKTLFEVISDEYAEYGYKMPKLVFWNICSRTNAVPIQENENGVVLVSGFSPTIASMVFSTKLNPYDVLLEKLNSERYDKVEKAIENETFWRC
jgi:hypothetical protein